MVQLKCHLRNDPRDEMNVLHGANAADFGYSWSLWSSCKLHSSLTTFYLSYYLLHLTASRTPWVFFLDDRR
jgi:hypothetical protein